MEISVTVFPAAIICFPQVLVLPGNIASHSGKCSWRNRHYFHIYGIPDTVPVFLQIGISDGNAARKRAISRWISSRKIPEDSTAFIKFYDHGGKIHVRTQEAPAVPAPDRDLQFRCYRKVEGVSFCASRVAVS